jgi:hypothetical protein
MTTHQFEHDGRHLSATLYINCDADYFIDHLSKNHVVSDLFLAGFIPSRVREIKTDSVWLHAETYASTKLCGIPYTIVGATDEESEEESDDDDEDDDDENSDEDEV